MEERYKGVNEFLFVLTRSSLTLILGKVQCRGNKPGGIFIAVVTEEKGK